MWRAAVIVAGVAGFAAPAHAEGGAAPASNPFAVTWDVDAPAASEPMSLVLQAAPAPQPQGQGVTFRMPVNVAGVAASTTVDAWSRPMARFGACEGAQGCSDVDGNIDLRVNSDVTGVKVGALVRLGERLTETEGGEDASWRVFAAADAHAVSWGFDRRRDGDDVRLETKRLVGDAQVGVARSLAGGDLALGFVHREVSYEGVSRDEQFGGVTFVLSH